MLNTLKTVVSTGIILLLLAVNTQAQDEREWVDSTGKFKITGSFQSYEDDNVFIKRDDGVIVKIPFESLSLADREYVEETTKPEMENKVTDAAPPNDSDTGTEVTPNDPTTEDESDSHLSPVLRIESPEKSDDIRTAEYEGFESKIDFALIDPLPKKIRNLALVLYHRPSTAEIGQALAAISKQASVPPVMIQLIRECSESDNLYLRIQSLKLIAIFDPGKSFDRIINSLDDPSFSVRQTALDLIEHLKDERAIEHLIAKFPGTDRSKISTVLTSFGSDVEEAVFPLLKHEKRSVVADAILLLENIGTQKSVEAITPLLDGHVLIRMQAQSTMEKIRLRLGQ